MRPGREGPGVGPIARPVHRAFDASMRPGREGPGVGCISWEKIKAAVELQ